MDNIGRFGYQGSSQNLILRIIIVLDLDVKKYQKVTIRAKNIREPLKFAGHLLLSQCDFLCWTPNCQVNWPLMPTNGRALGSDKEVFKNC